MSNISINDVLMVHKLVLKAVKDKYDINGSSLEVLNVIRFITLKQGLECSMSCLKAYITGHATYNIYPITRRLIELGYIENTGKAGFNRRLYLSLSDKGQEIMRFLTKSVENRMNVLNDGLTIDKDKINIRVKKKKGNDNGLRPASGLSPVPMDESKED